MISPRQNGSVDRLTGHWRVTRTWTACRGRNVSPSDHLIPAQRRNFTPFSRHGPAGADARELVGLLFHGRRFPIRNWAPAWSRPDRWRSQFHLRGGDRPLVLAPKRRAARSLDEARFVVVDLETTGGRAAPGSIIEIGAYRMEDGESANRSKAWCGRECGYRAFIAGLTSITDEMVAGAPPIEEVLPTFREFLGDA